jgi:membrane-bound ClpP family serine protease
MDAFTWAFLLLALGLVLLVLEFFVPSSGALAVMCALSFLAAIGVGFSAGPWTGITIVLIECLVVPLALAAAVKWWPDTPIGRMILIQRPKSSDEVLPETPAYRTFKDLVGRRGITKNLMLPSGSVLIDGKSYDAFSEGMAIEPGQPVIVVSVSTQRLVVRPDTTIRAEFADPTDPYAAESLPDESRETADPANDPNEPLVKDIPDPFA